jgi:hypothetical protein
MPLVQMPDGQTVDMPDNPTPEQLQALQQIHPEKNFGQKVLDTAANVGTNVVKGFAALPMLLDRLDINNQKQSSNPPPPAEDVLGYDTGIQRMRQQALQSREDVLNKMENFGYKPETTADKYVAAASQGAGGALLPSGNMGLLPRLLVGASSGAGSEASANALGDGVLSRLLGGLAGGLGASAGLKFRPNNTQALVKDSLRDASPAELDQAIKDMEAAHAAGLSTNLNQHMPTGSNLDVYAESLANSPQGKNVTANLRAQPRQVEMSAADQLNQLPGDVRPERMIANNAQDAATEAIKQMRQKAQAEWQANAPSTGSNIPPAAVAKFDQMLKQMQDKVPNTSQAELLSDVRDALKAKASTEVQTPSLLDAAGNPINPPAGKEKYLSDALQLQGAIDDALAGQGKRALNTPGLTGKSLRSAQEVREAWKGVLGDYAPSLLKAKAAYQAVMDSEVDPAKAGALGYLAQPAGSVSDRQASMGRVFSLFDKGTNPNSPMSEIKQVGTQMAKAGQPEAFSDAVKSWFARGIDKAIQTSDNRTPDDVAKGLSDYFGSLTTNTSRIQGVRDMLSTVAKNQGMNDADQASYVRGFENWIKMVNAASNRPGTVAGTTAQQIGEEAAKTATGHLGHVSVITPLRQPVLWWARQVGKNSMQEMDRLLSSPEGAKMLVEMGKNPVMSTKNAVLFSNFAIDSLHRDLNQQ